jgi:hypothetical protein
MMGNHLTVLDMRVSRHNCTGKGYKCRLVSNLAKQTEKIFSNVWLEKKKAQRLIQALESAMGNGHRTTGGQRKGAKSMFV